jgi:hypothetical protein
MERQLSEPLLSRSDFTNTVLARAGGRCVLCGGTACAAHHILDRKLFPDGGYYLNNGAAVCSDCHWRCETTTVSVEDVRRAAGISMILLPPGFDPSRTYDKWGNEILADGMRLPGPLYADDGARRALARGGVLGLFLPADFSRPEPV